MKKWTEAEIELLRSMTAAHIPDAEISLRLERSKRAIKMKRDRMEIRSYRESKKISPANAKCPYFLNFQTCGVRCEPNEDSCIILKFRKTADFEEFAQKFCNNIDGWEDCYLANAITHLWENNEQNQ